MDETVPVESPEEVIEVLPSDSLIMETVTSSPEVDSTSHIAPAPTEIKTEYSASRSSLIASHSVDSSVGSASHDSEAKTESDSEIPRKIYKRADSGNETTEYVTIPTTVMDENRDPVYPEIPDSRDGQNTLVITGFVDVSTEIENPENGLPGSVYIDTNAANIPEVVNVTEVHTHVSQASGSENKPEIGDDVFKSPAYQPDNFEMTEAGQSTCQVCFDRGTGYHYSGYTCEGCKGFFKRTVQRNLTYKCKSEGRCVINRHTRNNCQACRYDTCIMIGMKREAVREDRSPGGPGKNRPRYSIGPDGNKAPFADGFVTALYEAQPYLIPPSDLPLHGEKDEPEDISLSTFMHFGYTELRYIIDWAKRVPGFKELAIDDQMALLKSSFMELNVLRLAFRSMNDSDSIIIADGLAVTAPPSSVCGTGLMLAASKFSKRLRDTKIDIMEFCILNALVLTFPDAIGVNDRESVLSLQTRVVDALRRYSIYQYPNEPHRYGNLLLRLPILRIVSAKAAEKFLTMTVDGDSPLSALVCEMMN